MKHPTQDQLLNAAIMLDGAHPAVAAMLPAALPSAPAWLPSAEWTACVKLPVTVHVRQQRPGETHVSTREGITPLKPDDLIMRGVSGEEYPIGREIFEKTYQLGEAPPPRKPLTDEEIDAIYTGVRAVHHEIDSYVFARAIEAAHGITEKT